MMPDILHDITFHLLRPWWLLAILPALGLAWLLLKPRTEMSGWATVIDSELLGALLDSKSQSQKKWPILTLLFTWILATLAIAGPCFEKNNQAALKQADAVVILLDLSPSMLGQDIKPSRLQAAHYKILDLLRQRREGYTGLIAYSGSAHVVAPLSDDTNTIAALVTTLEPRIMPSIGSKVEEAVSEALQLLQNSHFTRGRLLLVTDGVVPEALQNIHQQLKGKSVELNVIGIGTAEGAPIGLQGGGFVKDKQGNILMNKLDEDTLQKLAQENGGHYSQLRTDDADIAPVIGTPDWLTQLNQDEQRNASHTVENWQDSGYWLALPCLLLALLFFRRGVLLCLLPLLFLTHQESVRADSLSLPESWQDWWQTPDQQAAKALQQGDAARAAKQFSDPQWKAYAEYQNGQHREAAEHFATSDSATANYNRGNAQARAGDLQGALDSYDQSLKQQPGFSDAEFNRDLVKKLLEKQKQDQKQQQNQKNQQQNQKEQQQNQDQQQNQNQQQDQDQQQQSQDQQQQQNQNQQQDQNQNQQQDQNQQQSQNQDQDQDQQQNQDQKQSEAEKEKQSSEQKSAESQKEKEDNKTEESQKSEEKSQTAKNDGANLQDDKHHSNQEKQQATEQWLRKVPDDPGGLLKNKFEYYYQLNRQKEALDRRFGTGKEEEQRW